MATYRHAKVVPARSIKLSQVLVVFGVLAFGSIVAKATVSTGNDADDAGYEKAMLAEQKAAFDPCDQSTLINRISGRGRACVIDAAVEGSFE